MSIERFVQDLRNHLQRQGLLREWMDQVLPKVIIEFGSCDSPAASAQYRGGVKYYGFMRTFTGGTITLNESVSYPNGRLDERQVPEIVHELWHAYVDLVAGKQATELARRINTAYEGEAHQLQFRRRSVDSRLYDYVGHEQESLSGRFQGSKAHVMADELLGYYLEHIMEAALAVCELARTEQEAQGLWDEVIRKSDTEYLSSDYVKHAGSFPLAQASAETIRSDGVGLSDRVSEWPQQLRGWRRWTGDDPVVRATLDCGQVGRRASLSECLRRWAEIFLGHPRSPLVAPYQQLDRPQVRVGSAGWQSGKPGVVCLDARFVEEVPLHPEYRSIKLIRVNVALTTRGLATVLSRGLEEQARQVQRQGPETPRRRIG